MTKTEGAGGLLHLLMCGYINIQRGHKKTDSNGKASKRLSHIMLCRAHSLFGLYFLILLVGVGCPVDIVEDWRP